MNLYCFQPCVQVVICLQHPQVLSAVAKALINKKDISSPSNRQNRVGQVVRFTGWRQNRIDALEAQSSGSTARQPLYSPAFSLQLSANEWMDAWASPALYILGLGIEPTKIVNPAPTQKLAVRTVLFGQWTRNLLVVWWDLPPFLLFAHQIIKIPRNLVP